MTDAAHAGAPRGLVAGIAAGWVDIRASTAREIASDAGEGRLLAYAMGGCFALWLGRTPEIMLAAATRATTEGAEVLPLGVLLISNLVALIFFTPLMLYAVAAVARLLLRAFGGRGDWRATRTAVFWSLLVAGPAFILAGLAGFALALAGAGPLLAGAPTLLAGLAWAWLWSNGLAEAHGLRRAWPIFAVMAASALALRLAALFSTPG